MPIYKLERTQIVPMPIEQCWRFFSDPRNLDKITPRSLAFRIKSSLPNSIYPGLMIEYTVAPLFGIPVRWLTEITSVDSPHRFVDEQRVGPYRIWHHEHFFRSLADGQTEVRDLVHYVPPFGPFGAVINALVIRRQLEAIFDYREQQLDSICAAAPPSS